jgi:hypothetical protein
MKYRIVEKGGLFYPEYRIWWIFWEPIGKYAYCVKENALKAIERWDAKYGSGRGKIIHKVNLENKVK